MKLVLAMFAALAAVVIAAFVYAKPVRPPVVGESAVKVIVGQGHGSGVYIGQGLILTAAHVVDTAKDGKVTIKTEIGNIIKGRVLWAAKTQDVALLRVESHYGLRAAKLSCRELEIGEIINARGSPGPIEFFTSWGRVAGSKRSLGRWEVAYLTDMTAVMGMSGGPVMDASGAVVGLVVGGLVVPMGFSASLTGVSWVVPGSAICPLLGR